MTKEEKEKKRFAEYQIAYQAKHRTAEAAVLKGLQDPEGQKAKVDGKRYWGVTVQHSDWAGYTVYAWDFIEGRIIAVRGLSKTKAVSTARDMDEAYNQPIDWRK